MAAEQKELQKYILDFEKFEQQVNGQNNAPVHQMRKDAISAFKDMGFPGPKDEEWRFTNLKPMLQKDFKPVLQSVSHPLSIEDVDQFGMDDLEGARLVFVDGFFAPDLSSESEIETGVQVTTMGSLLESNNYEVIEKMARVAHHREEVFTALNSAFLNDGLVIHVKDGVSGEKPIHVVFVSTKKDQHQVTFPRMYVYAGKNSSLKLIEHYVGMEEAVYFTNTVSEIWLEVNATVDHYKIQNDTQDSYHIGNAYVYQEKDTNFNSHSLSFGAALSRNNIYARLDGENSTTLLNGLYMGHRKQHADNHLIVDHSAPHCNSHQIYRGILADKSHGVFSGKILVRQDAQKTDADQANDALLLSKDAQINSKPQLEIYADDVRCTHGATIGELHDDAIFYLMSRGIGKQQAHNILTYAFARNVIDDIKLSRVKTFVEDMLDKRLEQDINFVK
ncbi:MAG: Fe-S cluster assembly protein SufD [Caldithrix sp.]|nr:Fe-S cluster assembly protein SufD [Caldithrix sp.]